MRFVSIWTKSGLHVSLLLRSMSQTGRLSLLFLAFWLLGPDLPSGGENLLPRVPPRLSQLTARGVG